MTPFARTDLPSYENATHLAQIRAGELTEAVFLRDYVMKNRPVHIKNATASWPGTQRWSDVEYLKSQAGDEPIWMRTRPTVMYDPDPRRKFESDSTKVAFREFVDRISSGEEGMVLSAPTTLRPAEFAGLLKDVGEFPFVPNPRRPRIYPRCRMFAHANSYTDWHYHTTDEHITVQVVGRKRMILAPPDRRAWDFFLPIMKAHGAPYEHLRAQGAAFSQLAFQVVDLEPGDGIYIPTFWWHAAESWENRLGITVAKAFRTPLRIQCDVRIPGARQVLLEHAASTIKRIAGRR